MGFGYTGIDKPEADLLQRTTLAVTQFSPGTSNMVEAVASHDESLACHGDSGKLAGTDGSRFSYCMP